MVADVVGVALEGEWDGVRDAFSSVRGLYEGDDSLIRRDDYDRMKGSEARVLTRVSPVRSEQSWAYFMLAGTENTTPRWIFLESRSASPITDLAKVSRKLRDKLSPNPESLDMDQRAAQLLEEFTNHLIDRRHQLLPNQRRRAIHELRRVLRKLTSAEDLFDGESEPVYERLLRVLETDSERLTLDLDAMAERWLKLIRPVRQKLLADTSSQQKLVTLDQCSDYIVEEEWLTPEKLRENFDSLPTVQPIDQRIIVSILGVPN
ncbi:MAG: hypothetical protein ABEN55_15975 [Bradymonadaceae bacterium]